MKRILYIAVVAIAMIFTSCSTSTKVIVQAPEGTEIYNDYGSYLGKTNSDGKLKLKLDDDSYLAFLQTKAEGTDQLVPFALNYKKRSVIGINAARGLGYFASVAGLGCELAGLIGGAASSKGGESKENAASMLGAGLALTGAGAALMLSTMRGNQIAYDNKYKFLKNQETNSDIKFAQPVIIDQPKNYEEPKPAITPIAEESKPKVNEETSVSTRQITQRANRTLNREAKQVEGVYTGTGQLLKDNKEIENYPGMTVAITQNGQDKAVVKVRVAEADGTAFFENEDKYIVKKESDETFTLTHSSISSATIKIDKAKNIIYIHPRVNIENEVYKLVIKSK